MWALGGGEGRGRGRGRGRRRGTEGGEEAECKLKIKHYSLVSVCTLTGQNGEEEEVVTVGD